MGPGTSVEAHAWPPTLEGVVGWLRAADGQARLWDAVARHRLAPGLADDVTQDVLYRAWRALERGTEIDSVPAFTTVLLRRAARDMLRGQARRGELAERPTGDDADLDRPAAFDDPVAHDVAAAMAEAGADRVRRAVHALLGSRPWCSAAALAFVVLTADDAPPADDCPAPGAGVDPGEGVAWAALWYAGRDDCFEPLAGDVAAATVRARRSRAIRAVRALLAEGARTMDEEPDDA